MPAQLPSPQGVQNNEVVNEPQQDDKPSRAVTPEAIRLILDKLKGWDSVALHCSKQGQEITWLLSQNESAQIHAMLCRNTSRVETDGRLKLEAKSTMRVGDVYFAIYLGSLSSTVDGHKYVWTGTEIDGFTESIELGEPQQVQSRLKGFLESLR